MKNQSSNLNHQSPFLTFQSTEIQILPFILSSYHTDSKWLGVSHSMTKHRACCLADLILVRSGIYPMGLSLKSCPLTQKYNNWSQTSDRFEKISSLHFSDSCIKLMEPKKMRNGPVWLVASSGSAPSHPVKGRETICPSMSAVTKKLITRCQGAVIRKRLWTKTAFTTISSLIESILTG